VNQCNFECIYLSFLTLGVRVGESNKFSLRHDSGKVREASLRHLKSGIGNRSCRAVAVAN